MTKRFKGVQGGTSAGKTIGIEQVLIDRCQRDKAGEVTSIVSESFPHLKRGAIRDFLNIMQSQNYYDDNRWNKTDFTYTFETGAILEFFSADQPAKVRGPRRKRLFLNEANHIPFETAEQLEVRTLEEIFADWNPSAEFWWHTEVMGKRDDAEMVILTYKDNEALDPAIVASIEQRKGRKNWWQVYGLGQLGEIEGKIYSNWQVIDEIPHEARLWRRGLDFGYSVDPSVLEAIYEYNGGYIIDEELYEKGLSNKSLADFILNLAEQCLVIADSAEPKSIDEISSYGVKIVGAEKGQGSVLQGIQFIQDLKISVTKRSLKTLTAYRNYTWSKDKNEKVIQVPDDAIHEWSNPMDAIRYGFNGKIKGNTGIHIYKPVTPLLDGLKGVKVNRVSSGWSNKYR